VTSAQPALPLAPRGKVSRPAPPARHPAGARRKRELWCALVLPSLMLEVRPLRPGLPAAVFDPARRVILAASEAAAEAGVRPGQSTTTAWAMCPALVTFVRDPAAEERALARLAGWAAQFSPRVSPEAQGVVLEIGASIRLFGGLSALLERLADGLASLGYRGVRGIAPTPLAALWRARAGQGHPVVDPVRLTGALAGLPLAAMGCDAKTLAALDGLGLCCIGDLLRLPRPGVARRYGPALVEALDRALGRRPDPRPAWRPQPVYAGTLELPVESESLKLIGLAFRRLASELAGFVRARDAAVRRLELTLETERQVLETTLACHAPLRDAERLLALVTTRLEAFELPAPVRAVGLRADDFVSHAPERALVAPPDPEATGLAPVLSRIAARLGEDAVVRLALAPDHRPERAVRACRVGEPRHARGMVRPGWPLLLLAEPRRLAEVAGRPSAGGRLDVVAGPERIESGWWDGAGAARDYYRLRARNGAELWAFRDRARGGWYLHGYFL